MNQPANAEVLYEADCPPPAVEFVTIYGYGNQGRAQALCLRDGGRPVRCALRPGSSSRELAAADGIPVVEPGAAAETDLLVWAVADEAIPAAARLLADVRANSSWLFLHGLAVSKGWLEPPPDVDLLLLAPQGPGTALRTAFVSGDGLPAALAVEQDASGRARRRLLGYARAVGCARGGLFWTTFAEETVIDHFGEQAVLCGGVPALVEAAWQVLVEAGYDPRSAYIECLMQLKLLVDLMYEGGPAALRRAISPTALYGAQSRGRHVIGPQTRERLRKLLEELEGDRFARDWRWISSRKDWPRRREELLNADAAIEKAGRWVRDKLNWPGLEGGEQQ
ncbi:MAG: ketol-acid reductoisomerase [Candidatus Coatesbacteria bacterium]|nr:ketol-acid reductoisomerase [Candidatus Coatesbacteria bacterium]